MEEVRMMIEEKLKENNSTKKVGSYKEENRTGDVIFNMIHFKIIHNNETSVISSIINVNKNTKKVEDFCFRIPRFGSKKKAEEMKKELEKELDINIRLENREDREDGGYDLHIENREFAYSQKQVHDFLKKILN